MKISYPYGKYVGSDAKQRMHHGRGKMHYKNGDVYNGQWESGKKTYGKMILIHIDGYYEGEVIRGEPNGRGKRVWDDGDIYEGEWENGKRHGVGKYTWSDGGVYEGYFVEDKIRGKGKFFYANGDVYEGDFAENIPCGKGVKTYTDGSEIIGDWKGFDDAENAVRKQGKKIEYGSLKNGEFIANEVKEYEISYEDEVYETPDEIDVICRITDDLYELCGGDADEFEASPEFETSINKLMLTLISGEGCETRAAAQESAARLKEMTRSLTRLVERAEIGLCKLSEEDYNRFRENILSDDGDK